MKKQHAELAIQMALQGRWQEAAQLNKALIESFPTDVDAFNRLGKALTELGRYTEAREAYMRALEIDPINTIARKNLARLAALGEEAAPPKVTAQKLSPQMFIEETGKTGITTLVRPNMSIAARMTAGDQVALHRENGSVVVRTIGGDHIGDVEPRLGQRLVKLMDGGNQYIAAISAMAENSVSVFIRETFQHSSQIGKLSFPPAVSEGFRPYVKERLLRHDGAGEGIYYGESDDLEDWDRPDAGDESGGDVSGQADGDAGDDLDEEEE